MKKDYTPKNTTGGLTAQIETLIKTLADETDAARASDIMRAYLATCAKFHQYSMGNILLIMQQMPTATRIAGFHTWLTFRRYVKKGESGIAILAPCQVKRTEKDAAGREAEKVNLFFRVVYVFDVSQTDGDELPAPPAWSSDEQDEELESRLLKFAQSKEITVTRAEIPGEARGYSTGKTIVLKPDAGTKTLVHELAHSLLHFGGASLDRETEELEAEAVAYVVSTAAGLPVVTSANYIALWAGDSKAITARLDRIRRAADEILSSIFPKAEANHGA